MEIKFINTVSSLTVGEIREIMEIFLFCLNEMEVSWKILPANGIALDHDKGLLMDV